MPTRAPANSNGTADASAFTSEKVLERLSTARGTASKEANRLFLASLILSGLYLIKASGLRVDFTLLDTNIAKVPHGLFFFLVASQISIILCYLRTADSLSIDQKIISAIDEFGYGKREKLADSFIDQYEWFSATLSEFDKHVGGWFPKIVYNITSLLTVPTWIGLYVLPATCGIYALANWQTQIVTGNITLQFWMLVATTALTGLWFINFLVIQFSLPGRG